MIEDAMTSIFWGGVALAIVTFGLPGWLAIVAGNVTPVAVWMAGLGLAAAFVGLLDLRIRP